MKIRKRRKSCLERWRDAKRSRKWSYRYPGRINGWRNIRGRPILDSCRSQSLISSYLVNTILMSTWSPLQLFTLGISYLSSNQIRPHSSRVLLNLTFSMQTISLDLNSKTPLLQLHIKYLRNESQLKTYQLIKRKISQPSHPSTLTTRYPNSRIHFTQRKSHIIKNKRKVLTRHLLSRNLKRTLKVTGVKSQLQLGSLGSNSTRKEYNLSPSNQ